jgi:hypothetical protein
MREVAPGHNPPGIGDADPVGRFVDHHVPSWPLVGGAWRLVRTGVYEARPTTDEYARATSSPVPRRIALSPDTHTWQGGRVARIAERLAMLAALINVADPTMRALTALAAELALAGEDEAAAVAQATREGLRVLIEQRLRGRDRLSLTAALGIVRSSVANDGMSLSAPSVGSRIPVRYQDVRTMIGLLRDTACRSAPVRIVGIGATASGQLALEIDTGGLCRDRVEQWVRAGRAHWCADLCSLLIYLGE